MLSTGRIRKEDIEDIVRMEAEIFPDAWSITAVRETFSRKQAEILGAWIDGKLTGYLIFYYVLDEGEIARIAVAASNRRIGVASHLVVELENLCEKKKITKMMLDVRESNGTAIDFYKSHGFTEDGIRKKFYQNPVEDAVLMSRMVSTGRS